VIHSTYADGGKQKLIISICKNIRNYKLEIHLAYQKKKKEEEEIHLIKIPIEKWFIQPKYDLISPYHLLKYSDFVWVTALLL